MRYSIRRITLPGFDSDEHFYGLTHVSDDMDRTLCDQLVIDGRWYIIGDESDSIEVSCKTCRRLAELPK